MKQTFSLHIDIDETFTIEEIWPDGDAPVDPTVDDVKRALFGERAVEHDLTVGDKLRDLGLEVRVGDVDLRKDNMARLAEDHAKIALVIERMAAVAKEEGSS